MTAQDISYWDSMTGDAAKKGRGIVANFGGTAVGDIALVPAMNLKNPKDIIPLLDQDFFAAFIPIELEEDDVLRRGKEEFLSRVF